MTAEQKVSAAIYLFILLIFKCSAVRNYFPHGHI